MLKNYFYIINTDVLRIFLCEYNVDNLIVKYANFFLIL